MQVYLSPLTQRPPFSPLATGLWAELCRCSSAPVVRQGLTLIDGSPLLARQRRGAGTIATLPTVFADPRLRFRFLRCHRGETVPPWALSVLITVWGSAGGVAPST